MIAALKEDEHETVDDIETVALPVDQAEQLLQVHVRVPLDPGQEQD
jgi:hypothetical protein